MTKACRLVDVKGNVFRVPKQLAFVKRLGAGAYGTVASFRDTNSGKMVAVKKLTNAFLDLVDGKRCLREVKLLRSLSHRNIVALLDMHPPEHPDVFDVYLVQELMDTDLSQIISSKQALSEEHNRALTYQLLCGLNYLHSADVIHGDITPANLLVNKKCEVKICNFALSRGTSTDGDCNAELPAYLVARWWRAPELALLNCAHTKAIDIWSAGCVLGELFGRTALFPGRDPLDQVRRILAVLGTPSPEDLDWLPQGSAARSFLNRSRQQPKKPWPVLFPTASREACHALDRLLAMRPASRATAGEAMQLDFFGALHRPEDLLQTAQERMDWSFDDVQATRRSLQNHMYVECARFHPEILQRDCEMFPSRGIDRLLPAAAESSGLLQPDKLPAADPSCLSTCCTDAEPSPQFHDDEFAGAHRGPMAPLHSPQPGRVPLWLQ